VVGERQRQARHESGEPQRPFVLVRNAAHGVAGSICARKAGRTDRRW
jgi:hypothetical protein